MWLGIKESLVFLVKTRKCFLPFSSLVKNLIVLPILVTWRLNRPTGFGAGIPANRRIRQTESQTRLLYRTLMPWLEGGPFGLSLALASLLCWRRGQPTALYIVPFSVIGISSMLWKEPWSTELGSRSVPRHPSKPWPLVKWRSKEFPYLWSTAVMWG